MYKVVHFFKRRDGLTMEDFVAYYEKAHTKFVKHIPGVRRYARRYLTRNLRRSGAGVDFDVMTELWYDDRAAYEAALAALRAPHMAETVAAIIADEEKLFDRAASRMYAFEEFETDLR
ncbi:MAG: EthD domain-containing protein [Hyphomonadaceae bacterium]